MRPGASITLSWPSRSPPPLPADVELCRVQTGGDQNCVLIRGDNQDVLCALGRRREPRFALAYLDPPFFTNREHARVKRHRDLKSGRIKRKLIPAFDDRWDNLESYLNALLPRIHLVHSLLSDDGCMVLHVDPKTSHYAKILCDEVFGARAFASEIVWRYRRWPSKTKNFQRVHDVLLRYLKNPDKPARFHQLYEPLAASTLATWGDRKQLAIVDNGGQRLRSSVTAKRSPGTPLGDVWDIGIVAPVARERTGYPTQKPEALMKQLIEACSEKDDWILDPYLGSGTTAVVARRLGRSVMGIDLSHEAISISRERLQALGVLSCEYQLRSYAKRRSTRRLRSKVA